MSEHMSHQFVLSVTFSLPQGSIVSYDARTQAWTPEWLMVRDERDLTHYRDLIAALPATPTRSDCQSVITGLGGGGRIKGFVSPELPAEVVLPSPLIAPEKPLHGSLTSFLNHTPEARHAIRAALRPGLRSPPESALLCPPLGANSGLVGTAFDTAFRFMVRTWNPDAAPGSLIAVLAMTVMDQDRVLALVTEAQTILKELVNGVPPAEHHARAAVTLASLEVVARTGRFQELVGVVPDAAWQDVLHLLQVVPADLFKAERQMVIGPRFKAAGRVGGADADLLLDDLLIDAKATKALILRGAYLQQLVGDLVLERLGGILRSNEPIRRLGVYYARHGILQTWTVKDLFKPGGLPRLVSWFDESLPRL